MKDKIKVLHILHELHPSGAEMMICNAYPCWKETCESSVMATGKIRGPFADTLEQTGYQIEWVPTEGAGKKAKIGHLIAFWKFMRTHHYDIVHIHRESLSFEYALIARMTGSRNTVRTVHSTFAHTGIQRKIKAFTRHFMQKHLHTRFVAISDGVAANEKKVFGIDCDETIYNWCNNGKFQYIGEEEKLPLKQAHDTEGKLVLVTVGNCGTVKNHELLLNAIARMQQKEQIHYYHVGYGKGASEQEEKLSRSLEIDHLITFAGSTDPMPYLKEADVFLMTSLYEGLSIATLEAIVTGMHSLWANAPGLTEVRDKALENVAYFDSTPESLAAKLDEYAALYQSKALHPSREQCARATELYDCSRQVGKYVLLYKNILVQ